MDMLVVLEKCMNMCISSV